MIEFQIRKSSKEKNVKKRKLSWDFCPNVDSQLLLLEESVANKSKSKGAIKSFFNLMKILSEVNSGFTTLRFATSYQRESIKIIESKYKQRRRFLKKNLGSLEYQLTMDKYIRSYLINVDMAENFNFTKYFRQDIRRQVGCQYPDNSVVMEIKTPAIISLLSDRRKSKTHLILKKELFYPVMSHLNLYPGFKKDKGKFYHLSRGSFEYAFN